MDIPVHDYEVMNKMQAAGVPAGVVQTMADILDDDPQLREREFLSAYKKSGFRYFRTSHSSIQTDEKPRLMSRHAPSMGEHTEYICINILGLSDEEFAELVDKNVFE